MLELLVLFAIISVNLGTSFGAAPKQNEKIVGGFDMDIRRVPYQVSLLYNGYHRCGGAIISDRWILTAAHCTYGFHASQMWVRAGSSYLNNGGQVVPVSQIINHENYQRYITGAKYDFDISLLLLATSITHGVPIALVSGTGRPEAGESCFITGWGNTIPSLHSVSYILQGVQLPIVSQYACKSVYGQYAVTDNMFCAGFWGTGGRSTCQGDSGGPVVMNGVLVGIVSWGGTCAHPYNPSVFTNVASLRNWIWRVARI